MNIEAKWNGKPLPLESIRVKRPGLNVKERVMASMRLHDYGGQWHSRLVEGQELELTRLGEDLWTGVVVDRKHTEGEDGDVTDIVVVHKQWRSLWKRRLHAYEVQYTKWGVDQDLVEAVTGGTGYDLITGAGSPSTTLRRLEWPRFGRGQDFDGTDILIAQDSSLQELGDLSVLWAGEVDDPTGAARQTLFMHGGDGEDQNQNINYQLALNTSGQLVYTHEYGAGTDLTLTSTPTVPAGFNVFVMERSGLNVRVDAWDAANGWRTLINGSFTGGQAPTGGTVGTDLLISGAPGPGGTEHFDGAVAELRLWLGSAKGFDFLRDMGDVHNHEALGKLEGTESHAWFFQERLKYPVQRFNPWKHRFFTDPGDDQLAPEDLVADETGGTNKLGVVEGVTFDELFTDVLGETLTSTLVFDDASLFIPSNAYQLSGDTNPGGGFAERGLAVFRFDSLTREHQACIQRVRRDDGTLVEDGKIETIPLRGAPLPFKQGVPASIDVTIYAQVAGADDVLTVEACRNADDADRDYQSISLSQASGTPSYYTKYTGSLTFTGRSGDAVALRFSLDDNNTTLQSTRIYACKVRVTYAASVTGVASGTVETYVARNQTGIISPAATRFEGDLSGMRGVEAFDFMRRETLTDDGVSPTPYWDIEFKSDGTVDWVERRGSNTGLEFSHGTGELQVLAHKSIVDDLTYRTFALGGGSEAKRVLLDDALYEKEFSDGGLYDSDRDPDVGALYGALPQESTYRDESAATEQQLYRRARAWHKLTRDPRVFVECVFTPRAIPLVLVGDEVRVVNKTRGINEVVRVHDFEHIDGGSGESWRVALGDRYQDAVEEFRLMRERVDRAASAPAPKSTFLGNTATRLQGQEDVYTPLEFEVPPGTQRVYVGVSTTQFQSESASGVTVFKGDTPASAPEYGFRIFTYIDPILDGNDEPSNKVDDRLGWRFGLTSSKSAWFMDITGFLSTDQDGVIRSGKHTLWWSPSGSGNNLNGLAAVVVDVFFDSQEAVR